MTLFRNNRNPHKATQDEQHIVQNLPIADYNVCAHAARAAAQASKIMSRRRKTAIPYFSRDELVLGKLLGRGGFNDVYEVQQLKIKHNNNSEIFGSNSTQVDEEAPQHVARHFAAEQCIQKETCMARFAVKYLSPSTMTNASSFKVGATDLVTETNILSSLDHTNIIKIRGLCAEGVSGFASGLEGGFFILLDRLQGTLDERILEWTATEKKLNGFFKNKLTDSNMVAEKKRAMFVERLQCAFGIAAAMTYLHSQGIVYRDLKPENIGFDCQGNVKIFDFGLAKELHDQERLEDGLYNLSGSTGSLRYMAPEVAKSLPYNLSADVYSFSILLWEICSLKLPYSNMSQRKHSELVVYGSCRPEIDKTWPLPLSYIMEMGWGKNLHERPRMELCCKVLSRGILFLSDDDSNGPDQRRQRSPCATRRSNWLIHIPNIKIANQA